MRTCIITGASQGIGRATSIRLSKEPDIDAIVLIARDSERLAETASLMETNSKIVKQIAFDLSDLEGIENLVRGIHNEFGGIDLLLNVAGYAEPCSLLDTSIENLTRTYTVNVFSALVLTRECVKYMRDRPAKILNVASTAGTTSRPGWIAYASSKAAVVSMSNTLADELSEYGIRVYTVSPGRCATELRRSLAPDEDPSTIMQPEQVADVIALLMNDDETCLDGQNIIVSQTVKPTR
jgi:3-oxoacyl-[acyl-carrier protein] reductase